MTLNAVLVAKPRVLRRLRDLSRGLIDAKSGEFVGKMEKS
jgi:hypothetical protein